LKTARPKLGVSLFSYSSEYYTGRLTLSDALRLSKEAGAEGVEIVASQMVPGFPWPSDKWLHDFRDQCEAMGLEPFCYSAHLDSGLRCDRMMTDDEKLLSTINDLRCAQIMGASVVRTQQTIGPGLIHKIVPWAERYGVKVGVEIHPPHRLDTPVWLEFERAFQEADSPYAGIVLDTGIYQEYPYKGWRDVYAAHGVPEETIRFLLDALAAKKPAAEVRETLKSRGESEYALEMAGEMFSLYRPYEPDALGELMQYVTHFHTKFYHMQDGEEPTIPYQKILDTVVQSGFDGYLISEYEGHYCYDCEQFPSADQVRQHIRMEKGILSV
jgi:sugar phosphate isomerase/epimerase